MLDSMEKERGQESEGAETVSPGWVLSLESLLPAWMRPRGEQSHNMAGHVRGSLKPVLGIA